MAKRKPSFKSLGLTFDLDYDDTHSGTKTWSIKLNGREVGTIEKSTEWGGDGYVASSYDVNIVPDDYDADDIDDGFPCSGSVWNRQAKQYEAREAFALCKDIARQAVLDGVIKE